MFFFDRIFEFLIEKLLVLLFGDYIDIPWALFILEPLIIFLAMPFVIGFLVYCSALLLYIHKFGRRLKLRERLVQEGNSNWHRARTVVSLLWETLGWIWYGYEIVDMDRIPDDSGALLIYYHGALPIDIYYILSKYYLLKNRMVHTVADNFMFKIPGLSILREGLCVTSGTVQQCADILRNNNILAIAPGGLYEAQLGDQMYEIMWRKRVGFAKCAIEARVPIIPVFTRNIRESFRTFLWPKSFWHKLYLYTRLPVLLLYGGLPVKLVTFVGEPIPYDPNLTPEQLAAKVSSALQLLIKTHQPIPGNIFRALQERLPSRYRVFQPLGYQKSF